MSEINLVQTFATVAAFIAFSAVLLWVIRPGARRNAEQAARLPFEDEYHDE
jgi:cbb3-type cytochrome oxidase subunit 3